MTVPRASRCLALLSPVVVAVLALAGGSALASADRYVPLEPGAATAVRIEAARPNANLVEARIVVPGLLVGTVDTPGGARPVIELEGGALTAEVGRPRVPVLRYLVEVPAGATVTPRLEVLATRSLRLATLGLSGALVPVQPPQPKIAGLAVPFAEDALAYLADAPYPAGHVTIADRGVLRGRDVVLVEVHPVRYNPARGTLDVVHESVLRLEIGGGAALQARRDATRLRSAANDAAIASLLLDTGAAPSAPSRAADGSAGGAAEGAEGLLVIVNDGFESAIQPLVDWKRKSGYKVDVVKTSTTPNDTAVKNAIQNRYNSWSNPSLGFVLLVGDTDFCPIHTGNGGGNSQVTDNWYACVDGSDYLPDLAIARISTRTAAETQAVIDKLMPYEKATFATTGWIKKAGYIGTADSGHISLIEGTHDYCIDNYMTPNGYQQTSWSHGKASCDRHYYTYNADTSDITASVNEGRSIINYSGHGATDAWAGPTDHGGYNQANVRANTNDGMYPFVISNACITNSLAETECFGETWQKAPHKGAIAFWGASNNSYWDEDDYLQRHLYPHLYPMDATQPLGLAVNSAKLDLYQHYGNVTNVAYYFDIYNLLAEPTLSIWTRVPRTMTVSYPASLPIGETSFTATVSVDGQPLANALVAVRKTADGVFESGYTDGAGSVTLTLSPAPASPGQLEVTVTRHDSRPFEGTSEVFAPNSAWLVHRAHVVDDTTGGDGDGVANPGEALVVPITVENVGQVAGTALAGTLTSSTPDWLAVEDAANAFPDLAPNQQGTSLPDHVRVRVSTAAPDGALLGFDLHWTAAGGASGTTSFSDVVRAVDFAYVGQSIDDSTGNGNGVAGPGETVGLSVTIGNVGHRDASGIHGVLTSASPYVTILEANGTFPDLAAGANGTSLPPAFRVRIAPNAPDRQPVTFSLRLTDARGYEEFVPFDVLVSTCATSVATDVPKTIADNSVVTSVFPIDKQIVLGEINVYVGITHTYIGDLKVTLISPAGTTAVLHDHSGSSADNITTWYDTETAPVEPLTKFVGENALGNWTLKVEDTAGGDTGTIDTWKLELCGESLGNGPALHVTGHAIDDAGSCNPDGYADVGETVTFRVKVKNTGNAPATGVLAALSSTAKVTVPAAPVSLGTLGAGQEAFASFNVAVGAVGCLENAPFSVALSAAEGSWSDGFVQVLEADLGNGSTSETLEHAGTPPAGWTHAATAGTDDWGVVSTKNHTGGGTYSWFVSDTPTTKDDTLYTPVFALGASPTADFWHFMTSHAGHDGAVMELSADGGASWVDLGSRMTGGYDQAMVAGPLTGRQGWTGKYTDWKHTVVDLHDWAGQSVQFRFRYACDNTWALTGWWIDDLTVTTRADICDAHACGIPGEAMLTSVVRDGAQVVLNWRPDPLAVSYKVQRGADVRYASAFSDVTGEDPNATDTTFRDASSGNFAAWIVVEQGPDGLGPWGHFGL